MDEKFSVFELGVTPEQIVGYAYAGLFAALCFALVSPQDAKVLIESLGNLLSILIILGLGIGIYTFYFKFLGEFILWPFVHFLHDLVDRIRGFKGNRRTSVVGYLEYLGVLVGYRRIAYEAVKSSFYKIEERRRIQLAHGELHVLYLTAIELLGTFLWIRMYHGISNLPFFTAGTLCYVVALTADIRQHALESFKLRAYNEKTLVKFLEGEGLIAGKKGKTP